MEPIAGVDLARMTGAEMAALRSLLQTEIKMLAPGTAERTEREKLRDAIDHWDVRVARRRLQAAPFTQRPLAPPAPQPVTVDPDAPVVPPIPSGEED